MPAQRPSRPPPSRLNGQRWCPQDEPASEGELEKKRITFHFIPPSSTDLCQPAHANIIEQLRSVWKDQWKKQKQAMAMRNEFSSTPNNRASGQESCRDLASSSTCSW